MARENQGLQIALIIFVMLTIILGVTTYLFFRQYEEADIKAKANLEEAQKKTQLAATNENDTNELKRLIGVPKTDKVEDIISKMFKDDMSKFGAGYTEDVLFYRPLLEKMSKTIQEKNADVKALKDKIAKLEDDFKVREANKQPQIDKFKQSADAASKDLADERSKFQGERDRISQDAAKLKTDLDAARKESVTAIDAATKKLDSAVVEGKKIKEKNGDLAKQLEKILSQKIDIPSGEIMWANQRAGTVWINLGRGDALQRKTSFSVYPANIADLSNKARKASVEVTQIVGDHLAEAKITEDKLTDPVMPGDKIYTPVWTPGDKRHFVLAGYIDLDKDGRSDMQTVIDAIKMNGGAVDGYIDDKGKRVGEININTRFLVLGEAPTEKGQPAVRDAFIKMVADADRLGIQKIQLGEMLDRMGWKEMGNVVQFGRGGNPRDFTPKADGVQRKSSGSVSDVFQPRNPGSSKAPGSSGNKQYFKFGM